MTDAAAKKQARAAEQERERQRQQAEAVDNLRDILKKRNLAICVGSGVTLSSIQDAQRSRLTWTGLLNNGFNYLERELPDFYQQQTKAFERARELLDNNEATADELIEAASKLRNFFQTHPGKLADWLSLQFKQLPRYVNSPTVLESLKKLHQKGTLLMTTNYDGLIETYCDMSPLDSSDKDKLMEFNRRQCDGVFHPHGYWKNSQHIILDAIDYYEVQHDDGVQETLRNIFTGRTVLFVGCGGGLADPNIGALLKWLGKKEENIGSSHYILLRRDDINPVPQLPLKHVRCEGYDAIGPWLENLLDQSERSEGTIYDIPEDSQRRRIHAWLAPADQSGFLNATSNMLGLDPSDWPMVPEIVKKWKAFNPSLLWINGEEGCGKTTLCSSIISHTQSLCLPPAYRRHRDSLAFFYCSTFDVYEMNSATLQHDFSTFLRTIIAHLCPPHYMFSALGALYQKCTRHHPARNATNTELQAVLIEIIDSLCKVASGGDERGESDPTTIPPGETYLIVDALDRISTDRRDDYLKFIKKVAGRDYQHLHLLITSRDEAGMKKALLKWGKWTCITLDRKIMERAAEAYVRNALQSDSRLEDLPLATERIITRLVDEPGGTFGWIRRKVRELKELKEFHESEIDKLLPPKDTKSQPAAGSRPPPRLDNRSWNSLPEPRDKNSKGAREELSSPDGSHTGGFKLVFDRGNSRCGTRPALESDSWIRKYRAFLTQWICPMYDKRSKLEQKAPPIRIAILDVGFNRNDPFIQGAKDRIKEVKNFVTDSPSILDATGRGTHALALLLELAPGADVIVARVAEDGTFEGSTNTAKAIAQAVLWATEDCKAHILVLPFSMNKDARDVKAAIRKAFLQNTTVFSAAVFSGLSETMGFPASVDGVIAVIPRRYSKPQAGGGDIIATLGECVRSSGPPSKPGSRLTRLLSGSSVATVIAAAMVATALDYANHILREDIHGALKPAEEMRALINLLDTGYRDLSPWALFKEDAQPQEVEQDIRRALPRINI